MNCSGIRPMSRSALFLPLFDRHNAGYVAAAWISLSVADFAGYSQRLRHWDSRKD